MLPAVPFWFLRHGETDWNTRSLAQGNVDIPLNETGRMQARLAAERLRGQAITGIVCSPLGRARETARIVASTLDLGVSIEPDLRECAYGVREGEPMSAWFDAWVAGRDTPEGGESFADLTSRASAALNRVLAAPSPVLVVGHGGWFRAVRGLMGLEPNVRAPNAVSLFCRPDGAGWRLEPAGEPVAAGTGFG